MAKTPQPTVRPMSVLGWEIATTLPSSTSAAVNDLVGDCIYKPWFAPPQPALSFQEARILVANVLSHEVGPFVDGRCGPGSLVRDKGKRTGQKRLYSLTLGAQRFVSDEFEKVQPALRKTFSRQSP